jgi:hypothetical protein
MRKTWGLYMGTAYGEVLLERKKANWVRDQERKKLYAIANAEETLEAAKPFIKMAEQVKVIRIALPGTYEQFQIPSRKRRAR